MSGRKKHPVWKFYKKGEKKNNSHYWAICACGKEVGGVAESMIAHLKTCKSDDKAMLKEYQPERYAQLFGKPAQSVEQILQSIKEDRKQDAGKRVCGRVWFRAWCE